MKDLKVVEVSHTLHLKKSFKSLYRRVRNREERTGLGLLMFPGFPCHSSPVYDRTCSTKAGVMDDCGGVR